MGYFVNAGKLDHSKGKCKEALVLEGFTYHSDDGTIYTIKGGWITDGASFGWRLLGCPFGGCYTEAAVLHDILYKSQAVSREKADALLKEANEALKTSFIVTHKMNLGVRCCGWNAWRKNKPHKDEFIKYIHVSV